MRGTPASRGQSFIARDHRYVYLGGSVIALVGLSLWYSAPSPYSFLPAGSVPGTALAAVCYFFLAVSTLALLVKWTHWSSYGETILKRPALVRLSRYLSYLDAAAAALLALDRFVLKLAYVVHAAVHAESNPTGTLSSMVYMAYNQRSLFVTGVWTTVQLALAGTYEYVDTGVFMDLTYDAGELHYDCIFIDLDGMTMVAMRDGDGTNGIYFVQE